VALKPAAVRTPPPSARYLGSPGAFIAVVSAVVLVSACSAGAPPRPSLTFATSAAPTSPPASTTAVPTPSSHGTRAATPSPPPPSLASGRLSLAGLGPLRIGMSRSRADAAAGEPIAVKYLDHGPCGQGQLRRVPGVSVMFQGPRLTRIDVEPPSTISTRSGIHIKSTERDVKRTYPGRITVQPHPYVSGHYLVYTPKARSEGLLIFETDGRLVTSFRAGEATSVRYIEGCA
jgi:hypothetical protein